MDSQANINMVDVQKQPLQGLSWLSCVLPRTAVLGSRDVMQRVFGLSSKQWRSPKYLQWAAA